MVVRVERKERGEKQISAQSAKPCKFDTRAENQGWEFALLLKIVLLKDQPWAIRSHRSLKKGKCEQIALVALYKRVMRAICSWKRVNCSFAKKKECYAWKNQRANSQPCRKSPNFFCNFSSPCPRKKEDAWKVTKYTGGDSADQPEPSIFPALSSSGADPDLKGQLISK